MVKWAIALIVVALLGMAALAIYYFSVKKKYSSNTLLFSKDELLLKNKSGIKEALDSLYQMIYLTFIKMPGVKYYTKKTRLKFEMTNDYDEYDIRRHTGRAMFIAVVCMFISLVVLLNLVNDIYMSFIVIVGVIIITEKIIDISITSVSNKILRQMPETFTSIRHSFHEHGMIDEALDTTIDELESKEIVPQLKRIRDAITSENPEIELERYYDTAPNRFLKLFAGISYLTYELGDRKIDDTSVYLKNLNNILNEIYLDILKQDKLNYMFRSLTVIAVVPLIAVKPLQVWAESNFPALANFYNSSIGFIVQAMIILSIFISYIMLRIIKEDSDEIKFDRVSKLRWQDRIYKIRPFRLIVDAFKPLPHTRKYRKNTELIRDTNSYLTIEWLYVNKLTYALIFAVLTILLIINLNHIDSSAAYNRISDDFMSMGQLSPEDELAAQEVLKVDKEYVDKYRRKNITKDELEKELQNDNRNIGKEVDSATVDRIYSKIDTVNNSYLKFWHVLIAIIVGLIGYYIPNIALFAKNNIRAMEKENEIMQFQSIILMLMHIDRVDVQTILEWLCRFSYAFREPIATCLNNYEAGAEIALEELKDSVPNKDFKRIVEQLQSSVMRITIREAFDELETERNFFYERRKDANERLIHKKVSYGKILGFTPMTILIGGYLVAPLLIVSILQMLNYFSKMSF